MAALLLSHRGVAEAGPYEDVALSDHPVGYWRFEDGDVTSPAANTAASGAMLDGSYLGDGLTLVPNSWAFLGTAVSLDGTLQAKADGVLGGDMGFPGRASRRSPPVCL